MNHSVLTLTIASEPNLVPARGKTRELAAMLGFDTQDQTRLATAVSEVSRDVFRQAGQVDISYSVDGTAAPQRLSIVIRATCTGRAPVVTPTVDLAGRLVDEFRVTPGHGMLTVSMHKRFPRRAPFLDPAALQKVVARLGNEEADNPYRELEQQHRELLRTLEEVRARQDELANLNRELEDTNRGVVALYAELDEKADHLRRADQLKSTFFFHMSHEFRTPLNSIMALSQILIDRLDGPLTPEQERQVNFIQKAVQELTDMVNDLLDLAKVEAGKVDVHPSEWQVSNLFGTLRGMLRPLLFHQPVQLIFYFPEDLLLFTDQGKVSQIIRNFISNAIKFTERGEIRVRAEAAKGETVRFSVSDTGMGIAPDDQERIFQQFTQVDSARQRKVKGTGLGLPLSKRLAELLGGRIELESSPGAGSTFSVILPRRHVSAEPGGTPAASVNASEAHDGGANELAPVAKTTRLLVIDDDEVSRYLVRRHLTDYSIDILEASNVADGLSIAREVQPHAILLDLVMPEVSGFEAIKELKAGRRTREIPVIVHTSLSLNERDRGLLGSDALAILDKSSDGAPLREAVGKVIRKLEHGPAGL